MNNDVQESANVPVLIRHADEAAWIAAAVNDIASGLRSALASDERARLLLSGGDTPAPVYRALAGETMDWDRVVIALVDERWLPVDDSASNGRLVRDTLLHGKAYAAIFEPMLDRYRDLEETVAAANRNAQPAALAVFGMGADGHVASLFPAMRGMDVALASRDAYLAVDAEGCPGARSWRWRVSMTPAAIVRTAQRVLLIRGEQKLQVLKRALEGDDRNEFPVRMLLFAPGNPTRIHWTP